MLSDNTLDSSISSLMISSRCAIAARNMQKGHDDAIELFHARPDEFRVTRGTALDRRLINILSNFGTRSTMGIRRDDNTCRAGVQFLAA